MRLLTFGHPLGPRPGLALTENTGLDLIAVEPSLPVRWNELFGQLERVRELADKWSGSGPDDSASEQGPLFDLTGVRLLPPVLQPSKIICVGRNYSEHAEEQGAKAPTAPLLFSKASSCLQGPTGPVVLAADLDQVDAEAELAVVIGTEGRAIAPKDAHRHIAGYMCFNDISDRAAQFKDKQWFRGKSIDTGGPCGPWIVTPEELPPGASGLEISCHWNGQVMQQSNTRQMIFPVAEIIGHASRHMTLLPGDIIATGTPSGVGVFREPPVFLKPGDTVEVRIDRIGRLVNPVLAG